MARYCLVPIKVAAFFIGLIVCVAPAHADVWFCNKHKNGTIYLATAAVIGPPSRHEYIVGGWYVIESGRCRKTLTGDFSKYPAYAYADLLGDDNSIITTYSGNTPVCVHPTQSFRHNNYRADCTRQQRRQGYVERRFFEFQPYGLNYIVTFEP